MKNLRIATFNVNGMRARLPNLLEWLKREQPDIVCLQELKSVDSAFPAAELDAAGYGAIWQGQASWNGVAILARDAQPLESRRGLPGDPDDTHSRYIEAAVHGVLVGCLYLPNGNPQPGPKFDYKLRWMERLRARADALWADEIPAILLADDNVIPRDNDVWAPKSMENDALMQPGSRDAYARLLGDGWTDALATHNPAGGVWTYWDYQAGAWQRDHGFRIDHALLSPELADRMLACGVDKDHRGREKASDHAPVWVTLSEA